MNLSLDQLKRYQRQLILPELQGKGQKKLLQSHVLIIGAGGLGSPAALYLAAAGIGRLSLVDMDKVDTSNLQRQVMYRSSDQGDAKVEAARKHLLALNPELKIQIHETPFQQSNAFELLEGVDFVIDGCDQPTTKFLINDACVMKNIAFSHAGALKFEGQCMTVLPHRSACLRCLFPEVPPQDTLQNCAEAGILGAVTGIIGCLQALEAIKFCAGLSKQGGQWLTFEALDLRFRRIQISKQKDCPLCGETPTIIELQEEDKSQCLYEN